MTDHPMRTLADGFVFLESPRWHDGRLWMSDMFGRAVHTLTESGEHAVFARFGDRPSGISFLPDGRVVVASMQERKLLQIDTAGRQSVYADLSGSVSADINDSVCDASGNIYVGNFGYDVEHHAEPRPADLILVTPARACRVVAQELAFPNGAVITPDGRTLIVAETFANRLTAFDRAADGSLANRRVWATLGERTPDGICLDREGAVWVSSVMTDEFIRVLPSGAISDRIDVRGRRAVACNLGGADGCTLFALTFAGHIDDAQAGRALARVETCRVAVPGAGSP